jgi:ferric-dicitrate binding protein FerR (iron transport regulator)
MKEENIDKLIADYLSGEISPENQAQLEKWLKNAPGNRQIFDIMLAKARSNSSKQKFLLRDNAFDEAIKKATRKVRIVRMTLKLAAAIAFFLVASFGIHLLLEGFSTNEVVVQQLETVTKSTNTGQKLKVFLPDLSYAWLNANSSISYEKDFTDSVRKIHLTGEAYFVVKKDAVRPFVVVANNSEITALGTEFNVNAYTRSKHTEVCLHEGKVLVKKTDLEEENTVVLQPGEMATIPTDEHYISKSYYDAMTLGWKNGLLYFKQARFDDIIYELEKWYGVEITYNKRPNTAWTFSGSFDNESLDNVLRIIGFTEKFEFEISGNTVWLDLP